MASSADIERWLIEATPAVVGGFVHRIWRTDSSWDLLARHHEQGDPEERGLRVAIAGTGLSSFQRRVRRLGTHAPALRADGTLDELARLNLSAYTALLDLVQAAATAVTATVKLMNASFAPGQKLGLGIVEDASALAVAISSMELISVGAF